MHFESEGDVVPMLCPGCCTIEDIPDWEDWDADNLQPLVGCHRCGFSFPVVTAYQRTHKRTREAERLMTATATIQALVGPGGDDVLAGSRSRCQGNKNTVKVFCMTKVVAGT